MAKLTTPRWFLQMNLHNLRSNCLLDAVFGRGSGEKGGERRKKATYLPSELIVKGDLVLKQLTDRGHVSNREFSLPVNDAVMR